MDVAYGMAEFMDGGSWAILDKNYENVLNW